MIIQNIFCNLKHPLRQDNRHHALSVTKVTQPDYAHSCTHVCFSITSTSRVLSLLCRMTVQKKAAGLRHPFEDLCSFLWFYKYHPGHAKGGSGPEGKAQFQQCLCPEEGTNFVTEDCGERGGDGGLRETIQTSHWCVGFVTAQPLTLNDNGIKMSNWQMVIWLSLLNTLETQEKTGEIKKGGCFTQRRFIIIHHTTVRHAVNTDTSLESSLSS